MSGTSIVGGGVIGNPGPGFQFAGIADLNGDNKSDIVFKSTSGGYASWHLNDTQVIGGSPNIGNPGTNWSIIG
ncbi:MAG TPA: hypothetical protein VG651_15350 [Stellaceae bacterium]|nr:hypothetical protein [Stellaceae bacterium]